MSSTSSLTSFNSAANGLIMDLQNIFGADDIDIVNLKLMMKCAFIDARLILTPFQQYILHHPHLVSNILQQNIEFFLNRQYKSPAELVTQMDTEKLLVKFKNALEIHQKDEQTTTAIFNWLKIMLYHAACDEGKDLMTYATGDDV